MNGPRVDVDDRGDQVAECRFCHRWFPTDIWDEHEYYCSGRAEADEYEAMAEQESGVMEP